MRDCNANTLETIMDYDTVHEVMQNERIYGERRKMVSWARVMRLDVLAELNSGRPVARAWLVGGLRSICMRDEGKWKGRVNGGTWMKFLGIPF